MKATSVNKMKQHKLRTRKFVTRCHRHTFPYGTIKTSRTGLQLTYRASTFAASTTNEANMATGTVKFFAQDKGFGFITPDEGGQDVFVHISAVGFGEALKDGQKVRYEVGQDRKTGKTKAENVSVI